MNSTGKVLHICNWYPNPSDIFEGIFIKSQIDALHPYIYSEVMHIEVKQGPLRLLIGTQSDRENYWILIVPTKLSIIIELLTSTLLLVFLVFKYRPRKYSIINFHIAYPLLTYFRFIQRFINKPIFISEHWSAYHFNFGVSKELKKIKKIFLTRAKLIAVSKSLACDIEKFSCNNHLETYVLPNVLRPQFLITLVDDFIRSDNLNRFFMVSEWKYPKDPFVIINSFFELQEKGLNFSLRIGGYGTQLKAMQELVIKLGLTEKIKFLGTLNTDQIIEEFNNTGFFLHASSYETFSVVCLEALSQGVPVAASNIGGIPDFVNKNNGILVDQADTKSWRQAIKELVKKDFDRVEIAKQARANFSPNNVGKKYMEILVSLKGPAFS